MADPLALNTITPFRIVQSLNMCFAYSSRILKRVSTVLIKRVSEVFCVGREDPQNIFDHKFELLIFRVYVSFPGECYIEFMLLIFT